MTPRTRFLSALKGEPTDYPSVGNPTSIITTDLMRATGCFFPEAHTDAEVMAQLAAAGYELLGYDTIAPYFSVQQEAAAFGCPVDWEDPEHMPTVRGHLFETPEDIHIPSDYLNRPPTRTVLDALRILKKRYGDEVALVGKVMGPWTLAYHLFGLEPFLIRIIDAPDEVAGILERLMNATIMFAQAQIEAGADCLTLADHLTGDLCRAETYRDFLLPLHQRIREQLDIPIVLHICGYTLDRLDYIAQTGFDAFHFDSKNDAHRAVEIAGDRIALIGNVNNPETLYQGKMEQIDIEVAQAIDAGVAVIAPECAVPLNMDSKGLKRIADVARRKT